MPHLVSSVVELRHLRCFVAVAEELSFNRAATRLRVSQQQVSRTLHDLEEIVGAPLMERTTRKVDLSAIGEVFLPRARHTLESLEMAVHQTRMAAKGKMAGLTVSFSGYAIESLLPEVFQRFKSDYPEINLDIREQNSGGQIASLQRKEIDAAFGICAPVSPEIDKVVLCRSPYVVIAPSSSTGRGPCNLARFRDAPFLEVPRQVAPGFYEDCALLFEEAGFKPNVVQEGHTTQTLLSLVAAGVGLALGPAFLARHRRAGIRFIPLKSSRRIELALISRGDNHSMALHALKKIAASIYLQAARQPEMNHFETANLAS